MPDCFTVTGNSHFEKVRALFVQFNLFELTAHEFKYFQTSAQCVEIGYKVFDTDSLIALLSFHVNIRTDSLVLDLVEDERSYAILLSGFNSRFEFNSLIS